MPTTDKSAPAPTVRLRNITHKMSVSIDVPWKPLRAHPRMQRGLHLRPLFIGPGQDLDLCAQLGCTYSEARNIANSKIVKAFVRAGKLAVLMAGVEPPKPTQAPLVPGKEIRSVLDAEIGPRMVEAEQGQPTPIDEPELPPEAHAAPRAAPPASFDDLAAGPSSFDDLDTSDEATADEVTADNHPTSEWTNARLKAYADMHDIDLGEARGKNAMLKKIRGAMSES